MTGAARLGVERFVSAEGFRVRVRSQGEGRPLLLINGLGAHLGAWSPLLAELKGFEVISFDAPGTGHSQTPSRPYTISRIAAVASAVLDACGHASADVLGYSLGGAVAQRLAFQAPDRVRRLVLVSSSCGAGGVPGSLRALLAVMTPARHYVKTGHRVAMKMVDLAPAEKDSTVAVAQSRNWHRDAPPSVLGYALQMGAFSTFNSLPWLHRVEHPTLVLSGADDHIMPMANSALLAAYLPNARLRTFDRWGHYLLQDATSGAGATVADFLSAKNYAWSSSWRGARVVSREDLTLLVQETPRSAHPSRYTNGLVRRLYPLHSGAH